MASRVNYYRVADLLGSQHAPVDLNRFPHSWLSFRLRADFMESELEWKFVAARLLVVGNALGNARADVHKVSDIFAGLYRRLSDSIPYISGQRSSAESQADRDRAKLIEEYEKMVIETRSTQKGTSDG